METAAIIIAALAAGFGAYAALIEPQNIRVRELELSFPNLPADFDGYTILHISDLHLSKLGRLERRAMRIIADREVDACLVTGDVTADPRASDIFRRVCSSIRSKEPIYLILGNSEHKPWLDTETLVEALSFDGLEMLINSSASISRGDSRMVLAGVDDPYSDLDDIEAAFDGVDPGEFIIFLTHCPSTTPQAIGRGADLILSGHTHGGQVRLPFVKRFWTHMRANKALNDGVYLPEDLSRLLNTDAGHSVLFVNRGLGTSRLPLRFLCPPEIALITLRQSGDTCQA